MLIDRLAIIGIGLIGGSLARALKRAGEVGTVIGCARRRESLDRALSLGVIDEAQMDAAVAARGADVVVLAVPLPANRALFTALSTVLGPETVVTDVGSVKGCVVEDARATLDPAQLTRLVPGHPVAGTEKSGVEHSFAALFEGQRVILTPLPETSDAALERINRMWRLAGADVELMEVGRHDEILAATSHLPHALAYVLVDCLAGMEGNPDVFRYAGGGFADFTRIASSSPEMWRDICFANDAQLLKALERYSDRLSGLIAAIRRKDSAAVAELFRRAKAARDEFAAMRNAARAVTASDRNRE
jgi:prephenate dehydrogenase